VGGSGLPAEYTHAVGAHGLATGFGDTGSVGLGGITLGGGVGFLSGRLRQLRGRHPDSSSGCIPSSRSSEAC
jgi:hypothetical protein